MTQERITLSSLDDNDNASSSDSSTGNQQTFLSTVCSVHTVEKKISRTAFTSATNTKLTTSGKVLNFIEAFQRREKDIYNSIPKPYKLL